MTAPTDSQRALSIRMSSSTPMIWTTRGSTQLRRADRTAFERGRLVWSTQVFNEFCSVMMGPKRKTTLSADEVTVIIRELSATGGVIPITPSLTFRALDAMPRHSLSFWDELIWSAAVENKVAIIYTEDFQDGREVEGVRLVNPFATRVSLGALITARAVGANVLPT